MHYKSITILIFVVLMMLVGYLVFSESNLGLLIIGLAVPLLVIAQTLVILMAPKQKEHGQANKMYEHD